MPASQPNPEYHYYRAPYPILSFVAGLYCDKHWSDEEFEKWEASEDKNTHVYHYKGYRFPYPIQSESAKHLFDVVVPDQNHHPDEFGRKAPNNADCNVLWDDLVAELKQPAQPRGDGRLPLFYEKKATLSTVAAIYLGDDVSAKQALSYWKREKDNAALANFQRLLEVKGTPGAEAVLNDIKQALFADLVLPPNCW